jgi:hypothetical protein
MADIDIDALRARHAPMRIYDECDHDHNEADVIDGRPSLVDTGEFITCEDAYLYSICRWCCCENPEWPEQAEWCADRHNAEHRAGHTCDVPALLDALAEARADADYCDGCGSPLTRCLAWHHERDGQGKCCPDCKHPAESRAWTAVHAALAEARDALAITRDERDVYLEENRKHARGEVYAERDRLIAERDEAWAEVERLRNPSMGEGTDLANAEQGKQHALAMLHAMQEERDAAREDLAETTAEINRLRVERDKWRDEAKDPSQTYHDLALHTRKHLEWLDAKGDAESGVYANIAKIIRARGQSLVKIQADWVEMEAERDGVLEELARATAEIERLRGRLPRVMSAPEDRCSFTGFTGSQCLYNEGHDAHLVDQAGGRAMVSPIWAEWDRDEAGKVLAEYSDWLARHDLVPVNPDSLWWEPIQDRLDSEQIWMEHCLRAQGSLDLLDVPNESLTRVVAGRIADHRGGSEEDWMEMAKDLLSTTHSEIARQEEAR